MCFTSHKPLVRKIAGKGGKECFKLIKIRGENKITSLYFPFFVYDLNKPTKKVEIPKVEEELPPIRIYEAYHAFDPDVCKYSLHRKGWYTIAVTTNLPNKTNEKILEGIPSDKDNTHKIMRCLIPEGVAYYENEFGEIAAEQIIALELIN